LRRGGRPAFLRDISFVVAPEGAGLWRAHGCRAQRAAHASLRGLGPAALREAELLGSPLPPTTPQRALARGLALVSEDRRRYGLLLEQSVGFNLSLSSLAALSGRAFIDEERERRRTWPSFRSCA